MDWLIIIIKCDYIYELISYGYYFRFMDAGGWNLIHSWLNDVLKTDNIMLTWDILKIINITHITTERLVANGIPKLVKRLSITHSDQSNNYI